MGVINCKRYSVVVVEVIIIIVIYVLSIVVSVCKIWEVSGH